MLAVEPIADSTPAPALELPESVSTDKFTREEREAWMKDGTVPGVKAMVPGVKTPDPEADPTKAASEPAGDKAAPPADDKPAQGKKDTESGRTESAKTEARIQELLKHRKAATERADRLESELAELKKSVTPAPPAEAEPVETKSVSAKDPKDERPKRLSMEEFIAANPSKDWKDYEDYKDDYHEKLSDWKVREAVRDALAEQESKQAEKSTQQVILKAAKEKVERALKDKDMPEFLKVVTHDDVTAAIKKSGGVMGAFFDERDVDGKIQYFLGSNLEEADRIAGLTPIGQARALNKLEDKFYPEDEAKVVPVKEEPASDQTKPAPVQEKKLSAASAPPSRVSGSSSVIEDEAKAALAAGNFGLFAEIENRRDIERAKFKGR